MKKNIIALLFVGFVGNAYPQLEETTENVVIEETQPTADQDQQQTVEGSAMELDLNIGIKADQQKKSVSLLNTLLADEFVLLTQTLNYHWNLVGPEFHDYHVLFDGQYNAIFTTLDAVAERVRALGGIAVGSLTGVLQQAQLKEDTGTVPAPRVMIKNLLAQHEAIIRSIRTAIDATAGDMGTNNFLSELIEKHEKTAWMLRSLAR